MDGIFSDINSELHSHCGYYSKYITVSSRDTVDLILNDRNLSYSATVNILSRNNVMSSRGSMDIISEDIILRSRVNLAAI
jgi:hypothetical protein